MKLKNPESWGETFLPKMIAVPWTWKRWLLFAFAMSMFVDSFLVPFSRDVDPGRSGDGMLFLILGFRAASRSELPLSVVISGGCLAALTLALNHGFLKSPISYWTLGAIVILLLVVMFWGRRKGGGKLSKDSSETEITSIP
jgi:hypothetical protein